MSPGCTFSTEIEIKQEIKINERNTVFLESNLLNEPYKIYEENILRLVTVDLRLYVYCSGRPRIRLC